MKSLGYKYLTKYKTNLTAGVKKKWSVTLTTVNEYNVEPR